MRAILLAVTMLACGTNEYTIARSVCRPGDPSVDDAVYRALTSASWFDAGCQATGGQPPTCNRVLLGGNGRYTWTAVSDAPERQQAGSWNFRARDATSGLVCLDDGSVLDFALTPDGLRLGSLGLTREHAASPGAQRDALPTIIADLMFVDLTAHGWANTNEMDLYLQPTSFALRDDGTFDATFRDGACTAQGTFSLEREPVAGGTQLRLWSHPAPNVCDTRSGGTPAFQLGDVPRLGTDGVLSAGGASYRDAALETDERLLRFSSYGGDTGLTISASWTGALRAGTPTSWAFAVRNDGKEPQALASLTLDVTPVTTASDGTDQAGPKVTAADRALSGTVAPGATLALDGAVAFTLGPAGRAILHVAVDSAGTTQTYHNQGSFLVELP